MARLVSVFGSILAALFMAAGLGAESETAPQARTELRVSVKDAAKGMTFDLHPDGRVEMTLGNGPEARTLKASSLEEFLEKYPEEAKTHRIERLVPKIDTGSAAQAFEEWKRWFEEGRMAEDFRSWMPFRSVWSPFRNDDLDRWVEQQRKLFDGFSESADMSAPRPALGVKLDEVDEALASQLEIGQGQGLLVVQVLPGTPAARAGLKKHDILLSADGKPVKDIAAFRRDAGAMLEKGFTLEVVRKGERQAIAVEPAGK